MARRWKRIAGMVCGVWATWCTTGALAVEPTPLPRLTVERPRDDSGVSMSGRNYASACQRLLRETYGERAAGDNAWPLVVDLINQHIALVERVAAPLPGSDKRRRVMPESLYDQNAEKGEWLEDLKSTRELARAMIASGEREGLFSRMAALCTRYNVRRPENAGVLSPWKFLAISNVREMVRLNAGRMQLAADAGDWTSLASAYEDALMLSRVAATEPLLVSQLVGYATSALARRELRRHVLQTTPSEAMLRELLEMGERQGPFAAPVLWLEGERMFLLDMVDDGKFPDDRRESKRLINEFFDGIGTVAGQPRWARAQGGFDAGAFVKKNVKPGTMLEQVLPAFGTNLRSWDIMRADSDGTRVLLALLVYKAQNGEYPRTLDDLVPGVLSAVPREPWRDAAFVYKRFDKPDESGRGFILYSVGLDGVDNGGIMNKEPDKGAFEPAGKGTDFVFNPTKGG